MKTRNPLLIGAVVTGLLLAGCAYTPPPSNTPVPPAGPRPVADKQPAPPPPVLTPEERRNAEAAQRAAAIANAKAAAAREPLNWRVFNELGVAYYSQAMYDQAIAAFQQALALHPITSTIEAETRQEEAAAAHRAALEAKRQAAVERAKQQQAQREMNDLLGMVFTAAGASGSSQSAQIQALQPVLETMNNATFSTPNDVPDLAPEVKAVSSLASKREVALIYANLGTAYFGKKNYPQAVAAFENVMQLDPSRTDVLRTSADAQYRLCKYGECIAALTRYHAIAPVEPVTMLLLSESFRALGMAAESNKVFRSFLARQSTATTDPAKLMELGALCLTHYRYAEAADLLARARKADEAGAGNTRRLPAARLAMLQAEAQFGLAKPSNAVALLKEVATPKAEPRAWYMLARAYDELGDAAKAAEAYRNALEAFGAADAAAPNDSYIHICRAAVGNRDEAIAALEKRLGQSAADSGRRRGAMVRACLRVRKGGTPSRSHGNPGPVPRGESRIRKGRRNAGPACRPGRSRTGEGACRSGRRVEGGRRESGHREAGGGVSPDRRRPREGENPIGRAEDGRRHGTIALVDRRSAGPLPARQRGAEGGENAHGPGPLALRVPVGGVLFAVGGRPLFQHLGGEEPAEPTRRSGAGPEAVSGGEAAGREHRADSEPVV